MQKKREFYLDLIRVFSCLCILTIHFNASASGFANGVFQYPNAVFPNYIFNGVYLGGLGASLFFMISGAALMTAHKDGCKPLKSFYKKRFLSLYPMFWLAFVLSISVSLLLNKEISNTPLYYLFFSFLGVDGYTNTLGLTHSGFYQVGEWFLGCIILLYLFYPLFSYGVRKRPIIFSVCVALIYGIFNFYFKVSTILFIVRIPEFVFGMLFAKYYATKQKVPWVGAVSSVIIGAVFMFFNKYIDGLSYQIVISGCIFMILAFVAQYIKIEKVKSACAGISKYTYAAFLVHHQLIAYLVRGFNLKNFPTREVYLLFFIYLVLTAVLSVFVYRINGSIVSKFKKKQVESVPMPAIRS